MKEDIKNRKDIELLVIAFYDKVKADHIIGYIFNDIAKVKWEKHLPRMFDFWENVIFYTGNYVGNPLAVHQHLHKIAPLEKEHFIQWEALFIQTVNELFEGVNAGLAKQRAKSISAILQLKIIQQ